MNVSVAREITGRFLTFLNDLQRRYQLVSILCFVYRGLFLSRWILSRLKAEAFAEYANTILCNIRLANQRYRPRIFSRLSWIASLKVSIVNMKYEEDGRKFDRPPSIGIHAHCAYAHTQDLSAYTRRRNLLVDFHSLERLRVHSWCSVYIVCRFLSRIPLHNLID